MEKFFCKTIVIVVLILLLSTIIMPISNAATNYTKNMKTEESYRYIGEKNLKTYRTKKAAKSESIKYLLYRKKDIKKNEIIKIKEIDGNILKLDDGRYLKITKERLQNLKKFEELKLQQNVETVQLNFKELKIMKGEKYKLVVTIKPDTAKNKDVTWKSSNAKIAKVSKDGTITAVKNGEAIITAVTKEGNKKTQCKVIVLDPSDYKYKFENNEYRISVTKDRLDSTLKRIKNEGESIKNKKTKIDYAKTSYELCTIYSKMLFENKGRNDKMDIYNSALAKETFKGMKEVIDRNYFLMIRMNASSMCSDLRVICIGYKGDGTKLSDFLFIDTYTGKLAKGGEGNCKNPKYIKSNASNANALGDFIITKNENEFK